MKTKRIAPLVLLTTAAMLLTACVGNGGESTGPTDGTTEIAGTLTFANWQWLETGRGVPLWEAMLGYEKVNPAAKLVQEAAPYSGYADKLSTEIGAGGGPDVMVLPESSFAPFASAGVLEPLDGVLEEASLDALVPANDGYFFDGAQYAYLWGASPYTLFWNQTILDEAGVKPPTTPDELIQAAVTIKEKTGKTGFAVRHQLNEEASWFEDYSTWPAGFGGGWSKDGKITINTPQNIAAATAFKKMYSSGGFGVGDDASTYRSKFKAGEVGMVIDNSSALKSMVTDNPDVPSTTVGASLLPFPGGGGSYAGAVIAINANSKNMALAKDFLRWYFTAEAQSAQAAAGFPSSNATAASAPQATIDANPWIVAFNEQFKTETSIPIKGFEVRTPEIAHVIMTQMAKLLTSDISAKEAMDAAQEQADALLK